MKRTGVGNKQIDTIPFFMGLGMGIGAVISLVFHQVMYIGNRIGYRGINRSFTQNINCK